VEDATGQQYEAVVPPSVPPGGWFVVAVPAASARAVVDFGAPQAGGSRVFLTPLEHLLTSFYTCLIMKFGGHSPTLSSF
jgi:hypothetical protein